MEVNEPKLSWGGPWTEKKLEAFAKYVKAYLVIMRKYPYWKTIYFDGFAGSGKRTTNEAELYEQLSIVPEEEHVYRGAAERVLKIKDFSFDYYYFIDQDKDSLKELENQLIGLPECKEKQLIFRPGDCNYHLQELAKALKRKDMDYSALIFLDPFGMQINWDSISGLKDTRSDIWILIPTGVIINRLLDRKGKLKNIKKLESFFGMSEIEIRDHFYKKDKVQTLFGETEIISKVFDPIQKIASLYVDRLQTIWKYVTTKPLILKNLKGVPIFHFVMASNKSNAVKIASQILDKS